MVIDATRGGAATPPPEDQQPKKTGKSEKTEAPLTAGSVKKSKAGPRIDRSKLGTSEGVKIDPKLANIAAGSATKGIADSIKHLVIDKVTNLSTDEAKEVTDAIFGTVKADKSVEHKAAFAKGVIEAIRTTKPEALDTVLDALKDNFPELTDFVGIINDMPAELNAGLVAATREAG